MQSTHPPHQFMARPQIEMVGIAENDLGVELFEQVLRDRLDGTGGTDRHKGWGLDQAMRQRHGRTPRLPTFGFYMKSEGHTLILAAGFISLCFCGSGLPRRGRVPHISLAFARCGGRPLAALLNPKKNARSRTTNLEFA